MLASKRTAMHASNPLQGDLRHLLNGLRHVLGVQTAVCGQLDACSGLDQHAVDVRARSERLGWAGKRTLKRCSCDGHHQQRKRVDLRQASLGPTSRHDITSQLFRRNVLVAKETGQPKLSKHSAQGRMELRRNTARNPCFYSCPSSSYLSKQR